MFLPLGWALNPTHVPTFVSASSTMRRGQPPTSIETLPEYSVSDGSAPPTYRMADLSRAPARPKKAHIHLPHDETRAGASSAHFMDGSVHEQNRLNFDVEANMAAATTDQVAPPVNNELNNGSNRSRESRPTSLDVVVNLVLLFVLVFWPLNIFLEATGELCSSLTSKVAFCGLPPTAIFFLWIAMFQEKGFLAISREGKTEEQYKSLRTGRQWVAFLLILFFIVFLTLAVSWTCSDGCVYGSGHCK